MKFNLSFRYRLALMAASLSLCTLFVVIWLIQERVHGIQEQRAVTELCLQVRRMALLVRPVAPIENMELGQISRLKIDSRQDFLMHWNNYQEDKVWQSSTWPTQLDEGKLAWQPVPVTKEDKLVTAKGELASVTCDRASFQVTDNPRQGKWVATRAITHDGYGFAAINLNSIVRSTWATITKPVVMLVAPVALVLSLLSAWCIAFFAMRPINRLSQAMQTISPGRQVEVLSDQNQWPEFQRLIANYNGMVVRLAENFEQASRFSADAAHELKTPLTILRGQIERAMINPQAQDMDTLLIELQSQVSHLSAITRKLLLLSVADAGHLVLERNAIDWTMLLSSLLEDASVLIKEQTVTSDIQAELRVTGDEVMLRQLCCNLITNAFTHGLPNGMVTVTACEHQGMVETKFTNDCDYISQQERELFFERFYRRDVARQRSNAGSGLGLSLAREIAKAHGGELLLMPSEEHVVTLVLRLPIA